MNVAYEHEPALAVAAIVGLIVEIVFLAQFRIEHDGAADQWSRTIPLYR